MPHSYTALTAHVIFSTKDRAPQIAPELRIRLFAYIGGIIRSTGGVLLAINAVEDHVHVLTRVSPTIALAEVVGKIKGSSSKWIHETPGMPRFVAWQRGYAAFSVSESTIPRVSAYIVGQQEHHRKVSFRDEFIALLRRHGIDPDLPHLWT
ncbi:MAG: IS200/IS605 family transposase [Thermoanaerobaculia bacterium]